MSLAKALTLAALVALAAAAPAAAHAPPTAPAVMVLRADGGFELTVRIDVAAWLLMALPGHVEADEIARLKGMPEGELAQLIRDGQTRFAAQTELRFDTQVLELKEAAWPTEAQLKEMKYSHEHSELLPVQFTGRVPAGAKIVEIALPEDLGRTSLAVEWENGPVVRQTMKAGETSWPLLVNPSANIGSQASTALNPWGTNGFWTGFVAGAVLVGAGGAWLRRFGAKH